ncbi:hypothetical protein AB1L42_01260 [Thalassoglobus sp. JC818]|uniref:hypothetical protein n=1 Tax=Thalassoglobus sp. JC818 TaxID=3232136 RepID=UPI003457B6B4
MNRRISAFSVILSVFTLIAQSQEEILAQGVQGTTVAPAESNVNADEIINGSCVIVGLLEKPLGSILSVSGNWRETENKPAIITKETLQPVLVIDVVNSRKLDKPVIFHKWQVEMAFIPGKEINSTGRVTYTGFEILKWRGAPFREEQPHQQSFKSGFVSCFQILETEGSENSHLETNR